MEQRRLNMVEEQIHARGVNDDAVLRALRRVPRHRFVPDAYLDSAYGDYPLPIGLGQTISQPYIVAYMTEALQVSPNDKILEVGTGSGYQAAVLAELAREVYTIEIIPELAERAAAVLNELGYRNIHFKTGDGYNGWPEHGPYNGIMVTAAPDHVPQPLIDQLAVNGRMMIPVGNRDQDLLVLTRTEHGVVESRTLAVRFVPLVRKP